MDPTQNRVVIGVRVPPRPATGIWRFTIGALVVGYGVVLLGQNLGMHLAFIERSWIPFAVFVLGVVKIFQACTLTGRVTGGVFALVGGAWTYASLTGTHIDLGFWWPIVLIALGVAFLMRGREPVVAAAASGTATMDSASESSAVAFWSGVRRRIASSAFSRADYVAVMGAVEVDLRPATTAGGKAEIEVFVLMGGIEIQVPPDWNVVNQAIVVMGGVNDRSTGAQGAANTLVIRGMVLMGGVEIKT
jgi:hypothetical protein